MKIIKTICNILLCTSILLFISTYIPTLYEPVPTSSEVILKEIQQAYQDIAKDLDIKEDTFTSVITKEDIEKNTSSLDIQQRATKALTKVSHTGTYELDETRISAISAKMQDIYEKLNVGVDTTSVRGQLKTYTLIIAIISEMILLILGIIEKKKRR